MRLFFPVFFLFIHTIAAAQGLQRLFVEDGLSSNIVFSVRQHYKGMIWFSTKMGIDRYDGYSFRHYSLYPQHRPLHYGYRHSKLYTDPYQRLWVTNIRDIFQYDSHTDSFKQVFSLTEENAIRDFIVTDSMHLFIATEKGLIEYHLKNKQYKKHGEFDGQVNKLAIYNRNLMLVAEKKRLVAFDHKQSLARSDIFEQTQFHTFQAENITALAVDSQKNIYVGFQGALSVIKKQGQIAIHSPPELTKLFNQTTVRRIVPDRRGSIYVCTDGAGAFELDSDLRIRQLFTADQNNPETVFDNSISDVLVDQDDRLWISGIGVSYYDPNRPGFRLYKHELNKSNTLKHNSVKAIAESDNGEIWVGTNYGISVLNRTRDEWRHITSGSGPDQLSSNQILSIENLPGYGVAIGTYKSGLFLFTGNRIEKLSAGRSVYSILCDSTGIWLGGTGGPFGLEYINLKTRESKGYSFSYVLTIAKRPEGGIFTGGHDGLFILTEKGDIVRYDAFQYGTGSIFCILVDSKKRVWCATEGQGLLLFDEKAASFTKYTSENGLPSNMVYGLQEDRLGHIWVSTTNGLSRFDPENEQFHNYSSSRGLGIKEFTYGANCLLSTGEMAFGGRNGFVLFRPENIISSPLKSNLVFTDLKLFNRSVSVNDSLSPLKKTIDLTDTLVLDYYQNSISIDFLSVNYTQTSETSYTWKLDGLDMEWTPAGYERTAIYTNLKPGTYVFRVKSVDTEHLTNEVERALHIVIRPPFWNTSWAYLIYISLAMLIIYFVTRFFRIRVREHHAQDKIRFFTGIAHDIRTPLSLISSPLSQALRRNDLSADTYYALKTAEYNSRRLSRMISQLLDFEKAAMNKMEIRLTRIPVKKVLEELCANFLPAIEEKGLIFIQDFRHQEILLCADRDKFDKIIFNLLSNAVKYTDPGGQIRMTSFLQGNRFHLEVSDTGSGIPKHQHTNIFNQYFRASNAANTNEVGSGIGLMLTKRLVELHQGRISFESEPGYGSRFFFWLPTTLTCTGTDPLPPQTAEPLTDEDDTGRNRKPRLLIAEDHTDLRYYLINNLKEDYHVFSAENGEQALGLTKSIFPDIILSDVMMPKVNGYEFCYEIKSCIETSHIPFILLSALNSDEHKIDGIKTGADIYLEKPFDLALLKSSLESLLLNRERIRDKLLRRELLTESDGVSELDRLFVDKANKVVERHFANPDFSVDAFEREMGMSHAALYRKFKTLMARTPLEFIQEIRMKKALELLARGTYHINEIAYSVGFSDPKYFSTFFKKYFGTTASEYFRRMSDQ